MSKPLHVKSDTFEAEVLQSKTPVLVDFFAVWCGPCKMLAQIIDELAGEYDGKVKVCKIDTDESPDIASNYGIMGVPTVMFFKGGEKVDELVGYSPKAALKKKLDAQL